jgi:16S rRNA processing protein RimM
VTADPDLLIAGRITGCYGIKGWVRIQPFTEHGEAFFELGEWFIRRGGEPEPIVFDAGRAHGKGLVAHIVGVDDRSAAEGLRGQEIAVRGDCLPVLEEGDYYWHQLQGLQVWCRDRGPEQGAAAPVLVGTVDHLIDTGANDVLVIAPCEGSIDRRERLIPYLPGDVVEGVDIEAGRIDVSWFLDD